MTGDTKEDPTLTDKLWLPRGIPIITTAFGMSLDLSRIIPEGTAIVVLCINDGTGYVPVSTHLPHQIYLENLQKIAKERNVKTFHVLPVMSNHAIRIAEIKTEATFGMPDYCSHAMCGLYTNWVFCGLSETTTGWESCRRLRETGRCLHP
jgi:hypothetical protein